MLGCVFILNIMIDIHLIYHMDTWLFFRYTDGEEVVGIGNLFNNSIEGTPTYSIRNTKSIINEVRVFTSGDSWNTGPLIELRKATEKDLKVVYEEHSHYNNLLPSQLRDCLIKELL